MDSEVRVRIAPSPTGDPHVGTAYIALFNYVFKKQYNGKMVLRIEDTDQTRSKQTSEKLIYESLKWLGLNWDEGPDIGGEYGPYRQSERLSIYLEYVNELLRSGKAYRCFCTQERLSKMREEQKAKGKSGYDRRCRDLSPEEVQKNLDLNIPYVVRLKVPTEGCTKFYDELRGDISIENHTVDDQVLLKSDGFPTYHLANVVDDHLMKITHVIRAEEWISSTPKHVMLYDAFGWSAPKWIHMPLLRNQDKSKISKRKNPVSLVYYRRAGYLPEAMLNFLALMGWNPGSDIEIFGLGEMIRKFNFSDLNLGGPVFDIKKLAWMNQHYLHELSESELVSYIRNNIFSEDYLKQVVPLMKDRFSKFEDFISKADFFFNGSLTYEKEALIPKNISPVDLKKALSSLLEELDELYDWKAQKIEEIMHTQLEKLGWKPKDFFMPVRIAVTGRKDSPPLAQSMEVIGREMSRSRIKEAILKCL